MYHSGGIFKVFDTAGIWRGTFASWEATRARLLALKFEMGEDLSVA